MNLVSAHALSHASSLSAPGFGGRENNYLRSKGETTTMLHLESPATPHKLRFIDVHAVTTEDVGPPLGSSA